VKALLAAKETAKFRNIVESIGGIVFVGCLHDESHPDLQDMCLKAAAVEFKTMKKHEAVESLRKSDGWNVLTEVMETFRTLRPHFPVRGFFPLRPTAIQNSRLGFKKIKYVSCSFHSIDLGII
jgi:hypothetical protein